MLEAYNVWMSIKFPQKDDLPKSPLSIRSILKCIEHFLNSHNIFGFFIDSFPHNSICTFTKLLENLELLQDMWLNFFCHLMSVIITLNIR